MISHRAINVHIIKLGWSIGYTVGTYVIISPKNIVFLSMKIYFVFANSADPDEMPHDAAFHLDFHCLPKYPFSGCWSKHG